MKITIFDMDDLKNPHWGSGQARVTREIGKRLAGKHEITVYSSKYPNYQDYTEEGIFYKHIGLGSPFPKLNNIIYIFISPIWAIKVHQGVILENFTAPFSVSILPLLAKAPVVGLTSFFASKELSRKYKINFYYFTELGIKYYKYVIALNPNQVKEIKGLSTKITVKFIPNGVDENNFQMKTSEKNYFIFIGRIDINQKGLDLLINALSLVSKELTDSLYIIGYGLKAEENKLKELIRSSPFKNKIKFLGKKMGKEKDEFLKKAKFVVCPSRYESQSLSALEALSFGKPVLCFDIQGFKWLSDKSSLKAKPFEIKDYSDKLLLISNNKTLRGSLSTESKKQAKNFSWLKTAQHYESFLEKVYQQNYA